MGRELYELFALGGRYLFAGLMLLIVFRAGRITLVDSRRAAMLRHLAPETGVVGELVVLRGGERAKDGMRYPVIREGTIGSSARADVRIRHSSVRRRHAYFQYADDTLILRGHAGAPLRDERERPARELRLRDGAQLSIGRVRLLLVLNEAPEPAQRHDRSRRPERRGTEDEFFHEADPFEGHPVRRGKKRQGRPIDVDEYFDFDDDDDE